MCTYKWAFVGVSEFSEMVKVELALAAVVLRPSVCVERLERFLVHILTDFMVSSALFGLVHGYLNSSNKFC